MRARIALALVVVASALAGCSNQPSIVGKWNVTGVPVPNVSSSVAEFKSDGTSTMLLTMNMGQTNMKMQFDGTYKLTGDKLTQTVNKVNLIDLPKEMEALRGMVEGQMKNEMGKPQEFTIQWKSPNEVTMTGSNGQSSSMTRL